MHLLPCACPVGPLEPAPLTALCATPLGGARVGMGPSPVHTAFWGPDDRYYLRRTVGSTATWWRGDAEGEFTGEDGLFGDAAATIAADAAAAFPRNQSGRTMRMVLVGRQRGPRRTHSLAAMHVVVRRARRTSPVAAPPPAR